MHDRNQFRSHLTFIPENSCARRDRTCALLEDPEFAALANQFHTKIDLAQKLVEQAVERELPFTTTLILA